MTITTQTQVEESADLRFKDSLPLQEFRDLDIGIAGLGASGRNVAILLHVMGNSRLVGADPDTIELKNVGSQGWSMKDVGRSKAGVLGGQLMGFVAEERTFQDMMVGWKTQLTPERWAKKVIFCCVDTMRARSEIWNQVIEEGGCSECAGYGKIYAQGLMSPEARMTCPKCKGKPHLQGLWIDSRMAARQVRVITIPMGDKKALDYYMTTLYSDEEAFQGSCTDRMTLYGAYIAAGLMISQLANWLNKLPVIRDFMLETMSMSTVRLGE